MPRSSRHRSHRSRKHSRDRSESEEDETSRERKPSEEEPAASPGSRVSRDPEPEKWRYSRASDGKEMAGTSNGDAPGEHGKKRKERADEAATAEQWNDDEEDDCKRSKREECSPLVRDKTSKPKFLNVDSRGRSSRRHDCLSERNEDSGVTVDSAKSKLDKDGSRRETNSHYKDAKERNRDRDKDRDKDAQVTRHDRSDDFPRRKHGSKTGSTEEEHASNKDTKIIESQVQDALTNSELEKELEKRMRRRDDSEDKDKLLGDHRDGDDRRFSSRDDYTTNRSYRDERHEDIKYRDKYRDDHCRDQKQQSDRHRDERCSRSRASERSENKHFRDESKSSEGRHKKSKPYDNDHDGSFCLDDHDVKPKDSSGKKRFSEENEDHGNLMPREMKEPCEDVEKNLSSSSRIDSHTDLYRSGYRHQKVDYSPKNNQSKSSASSRAYVVEDRSRDSSKQEEFARKDSSSEERICRNAASTRHYSLASGAHERVSEKIKRKDDTQLGELYVETMVSSKHDRTPRSSAHASPNQVKEKSPSTYRQPFSDASGSRLNLDLGVGQKRSTSGDGGRGDLALEKPFVDGISQNEVSNREATPSSLINRTSNLFGSSPNHLPPPLPVRLGIDSPSVFGSFEDDNREHSGNSRHYSRYRRSGDLGFGRGQGNWKSAPSWPSPVANGFNPLHHGLPPAGFHPAVPHFPAPPLFGVRPYNMHDVADSFPGHGRPFGWHNTLNQPHMQMWDANSGMFGDESHIYGRPEWDQGRHPVGSRGWEMGIDMWKGQDVSINVAKKESECSSHALADEAWVLQPGNQPHSDQVQLESLLVENTVAKQASDMSPAKNIAESPLKLVAKKTPVLPKITRGDTTNYSANFLSRLDISPELANSELYGKCLSVLGAKGINAACNFSNKKLQIDNNKSIEKIKNTSYMLRSLLPTAKDAIFQRAMSLYKLQQNGRSRVKIPKSPPVCSDKMKGSHPEASENEKVQVGEEASSEKTAPPDPDQQFDLRSDAVNCANGSQALVEDCRRPNYPESTH